MLKKTMQSGFLFVMPEAAGGNPRNWNAGECCSVANPKQDDVSFVKAIYDQLKLNYNVDINNVFAVGLSNGGFFVHMLACETSIFKAIVAVSGAMTIPSCNPSRLVSVLAFHGLVDEGVPFMGGYGSFPLPMYNYRPFKQTMDEWAVREGCDVHVTKKVFLKTSDTICSSYMKCKREVSTCISPLGDHAWPGGFSSTVTDLDAGDVIISFFRRASNH